MSGPFRAVVFDLDGVLWDGEPLYHQAFNTLLAPRGLRITDEEYASIIGRSIEYCWQWLRERFGMRDAFQDFLREYDETVLHLLKRPLTPLPGAREFVEELARRAVPTAVASASLRQWVDATLRGLGLADAFHATATASEVRDGKPAPDLYLLAAERIDVAPADCLAVEDTLPGIRSAKAAGMFAVQLRAASTALPPLDEADAVIDSYAQFDLSLIAEGVRR